MMRIRCLVTIALPALAAACASTQHPTPQLQAARQAYTAAARGPAATLAPDSLETARDSLERAESADFLGDPNRRDFAELARSRADVAAMRGSAVHALQERNAARAALAQARADRAAMSMRGAATAQAGQANLQAKDTLRTLADREEATSGGGRVLVVTSGLMFAEDSADLSDEARNKLDQIASAVRSANDVRAIAVAGFTDSTGSEAVNASLSTARAQSVAGYLESGGVPRSRIVTRGMATSDPKASNGTATGRAMNRRAQVEIFF